ncbi:FecR domain-containing protein [Variovorax sp. J22P168]|uniref:FecR family protein n=1 Tax=Variovorax jilinensis TaxID=3053513 RepID=UPI002576D16C|nr:FecR domain-containing protein [Variovorax sp. J22P168]MDM0014730.1 FecR domain-containing protein [Variovorax sp. J22P168]
MNPAAALAMPDAPDIAPESRMRAEAAEWIIRLGDEAVDDRTQADCAAWCARHPRHGQLLREMQQLWNAVTCDTPVPRPVRIKPRSRQVASVLGLLVLVPCLLLVARALPWRYWLADERTAVGEVRELRLADGSRLTLNSDSAVDIDMAGDKRRVRLRRGEIHVEVAKASTPFVVIGRDGSVRALGTRYAVRKEAQDTLVTVTESRVLVRPREASDKSVELVAGSQLRFDRQGITHAASSAPSTALAWQQGRLVFDDTPLPEVLRELARYRPGLLLGADEPALSELRFTGVLPTARSDEALALLAATLPLKVSRLSPWMVSVSAAKTAAR